MLASAIYQGTRKIGAIYKGLRLIYTAKTHKFVNPVEFVAEIETSGEANSSSSAQVIPEGDVSFDLDESELRSSASAALWAEGGVFFEFDETEGIASESAVSGEILESVEFAYDVEGYTPTSAPAECEEGTAEITTEALANDCVAEPMGCEVFMETYSQCGLKSAGSRATSGDVSVQFDAEVTVVVLSMPKFENGVLYIPTAYGATLNNNILEVR